MGTILGVQAIARAGLLAIEVSDQPALLPGESEELLAELALNFKAIDEVMNATKASIPTRITSWAPPKNDVGAINFGDINSGVESVIRRHLGAILDLDPKPPGDDPEAGRSHFPFGQPGS